MNKILKFIKNNVLVLLSLGLNVVVLANTSILSEQVSYTNSKTNETTLNGALNELFSAVDINNRLGNTSLSNVGDGTVTGAIKTNSDNISNMQKNISTINTSVTDLTNRHNSDISTINTSVTDLTNRHNSDISTINTNINNITNNVNALIGGRQKIETRNNLFRQGNFRHLSLGGENGMALIPTVLATKLDPSDRPIGTRLGHCYIVLDDNTTAYLGNVIVKSDGSISISAKTTISGKAEALTTGNVRGEVSWSID